MEENRLWLLIARHLSGEITPDQSNELQEILRKHPDRQWLVDILHSYFDSSGTSSEEKDSPADPIYEEKLKKILSFNPKDNKPLTFSVIHSGKSHGVSRMWRYVVAVAGCILLFVFAYHFISQKNIPSGQDKFAKTNEIISKSGVRTKLVLPDGTLAWLNAGSKLNYTNEFNQKLREVELEGEAFFDVVKDAERPFIVHVSTINIKVKGTAFVVKSYPQDETVETTLLRGTIEVSRKDNPNSPLVILKPNEKLIFNKHVENSIPQDTNHGAVKNESIREKDISVTSVSKTIPDSNKVETSWLYNRLVFDGDSFQELAAKMERWYNVKIAFKDQELFRYRFKGAFASESITQALDALKLTTKFSYQINSNEIILFRK
jgi:ferric-dicitrate binding protein FerR (iron transport regulator)